MDCSPTQRWRARRASYRPSNEPLNPSRYGVELLPGDKLARQFVVLHHYSGSYPAARCRVGLYRRRQLVGVAVFSVPASARVLPKYTGLGNEAAVELGRFVLLDDVPGNGETWFLARAFRALLDALPQIRAVVAFSDPVPRRSAAGQLTLPGHIGTIYQAHNGRHVGRTNRATHWLDASGRVVSPRALSKLRTDDQGAAYAYELLRAAGAPARKPLEDGRAYVRRALRQGPFRTLRHPGCLAYVWPLGRAKKATQRAFADPLPYPKHPRQLALLPP